MRFITNIDKDKYNSFVENHIKCHFLQSYQWGEFAKLEKNLIPHYVGIVDDSDNLLCTALLLQKTLPFGMSYFYSPRGFIIDYNNNDLLYKFTNEIKNYIKQYNSIFIKIDPDLIINKNDYNGNEINSDYKKDILLKNFKSIGFKHLGFTQKFETMQPRFSFRIDFNQEYSDIIEHFSKTTKQRIKKAEEFDVSVKIGSLSDIKDFYNLMRITENRKDFITHNLSYYETLYKLFNYNDGVNLFLGSVNIKEIIDKKVMTFDLLSNEYNELSKIENRSKNQNSRLKEISNNKDKINNDIEKYKLLLEEYGDCITLNGHYIIKYGNKAWVLYAGNHNILTDTYSNYKTYLEHINYYYDKVDTYDQFGTIGNIDKNDNLYGLHEFKKKFGGDYVEFIGEFDLITKKFWYIVFTRLVPFYRSLIKRIAKRKNRR